MPEFTYDRHKSFRGWLHTVTLNHWRDRQRRIATRPLPGNDKPLATLQDIDEASFLARMNIGKIWSIGPCRSCSRISNRSPGRRSGSTAAGRRAAQVAAELGLSLASVYGAKFRVVTRLRQELQGFFD